MPTKVKITPTQRRNLKTLAAYLRALPEGYQEFDMSTYGTISVHRARSCYTAACAVGHGPAAGIKPRPSDDCWTSYAERVFVRDSYARMWLFAAMWSDVDDTPKGAAARIEWLLDWGVPPGWAFAYDDDDISDMVAVYAEYVEVPHGQA